MPESGLPSVPLLSQSWYDRAALYRADDEWLGQAWLRATVIVVSPEVTTPVSLSEPIRLISRQPAEVDSTAERIFLGLADQVPIFAVLGVESTAQNQDSDAVGQAVQQGEKWLGLREVIGSLDPVEAGLLTSATGLARWHKTHTHCPRCGTPTVLAQAGWIRRCPADDTEHFPRTDPAVIMLVHDGAGRCLLGRGPKWPERRFSTLAGFVEPGESLEAAVAREVYEETGISVTDIRYVASQPWPFPASLMAGFTAVLDGDPTIRLDLNEVAEAHWFTKREAEQAAAWSDANEPGDVDAKMVAVSPQLSISRFLIDGWLAGLI